MDLSYSPEEQAFRAEVKSFLDKELSPELRAKAENGRKYTKADFLGWQQKLYKRGWGGPAWPKKFGGTGWSDVPRKSCSCTVRVKQRKARNQPSPSRP